jgi:hypothetical protein
MNDKGNVHDFNQLEYLLGMNGVAKNTTGRLRTASM